MKRLFGNWVLGPALVLYRYKKSRPEATRLNELPHSLSNWHLSDLKAYPDRKSMISSFGPGGTAAEIGVARGDFSQDILTMARPDHLVLIDYWKEGRRGHGVAPVGGARTMQEGSDLAYVKSRFASEIEAGTVRLLRDWSWDGLTQLEDNSLDWVYIDAGHDFDSVSKDLEAALPKLKPGGIIAGHDYVRWGRFGYRCGVIEAVAKFCIEHEFKIVGLTFERQYPPSYALRREDAKSV
jgi:hypothetical protein